MFERPRSWPLLVSPLGAAAGLACVLSLGTACRPERSTCDDPHACEDACTSDDPDACFAAAQGFMIGLGVERQATRAFTLFERACESGHAAACTYVGSSYELGVGVAADAAQAKRYYTSACNSDDGRACVALALMVGEDQATIVEMLLERGVAQLRSSCSAGESLRAGSACAALGQVYLQGFGEPIGLARDVEQGERFLAQACGQADVEACGNLADQVRDRDPGRAAELYASACAGSYLYACVQSGVDALLGVGGVIDPALGESRLRSACDAGEPRGCTTLATAFASGIGVARSLDEARSLYTRGCEAGDAQACGSLGLFYSTPNDGQGPNLERAAELFAGACEGGDVTACGNLGWMVVHGLGVAADRERGLRLLERACAAGEGRSCYRLGLQIDGNEAEVAALWRRGCELGDPDACTGLSVAFIDGQSSEDRRLAVDLARYSCQEGSASGCTLAGEIFALGWNVERDRRLAEAYFAHACELGDVHGCEVLATWLGEGGDAAWGEGRALRERACESGSLDDCVVLGAYFVRGLGIEKDYARAVEIYGEACEGGSIVACTHRAQILITGTGVAPDHATAFGSFERSCSAGDQVACAWLGLAYHRGRGCEVDVARAAEYYGRGCEQGIAFGCIGMGKLHEQGAGVRKSKRDAAKFFRRACELGADDYC